MNLSVLSDAGIDYEDGIARFSGHAEIYEKYLKRFPSDPEFSNLRSAMAGKDYEAAFRSAHTLKGMVGNLSIKRLYASLYDFVELLRGNRDIAAAHAAFPGLEAQYQAATEAITRYFSGV
ncbi:MAG: Hpt domain-containing protein [Oscillospiraceae bacterium]|nr:Hpt domain-containing protein [Oscillospiraceae bacterium]